VAFPVHDGLRCLELGSPGPSRQQLVGLVLEGSKRATAGLRTEYDDEGEPLEHVGEEQWLLGDDDSPVARVRYTRIEIVPFADVTWEFAQAEGEGFVDLEDWRDQHRGFWSRWYGVPVDDPAFPARDDALVVCLWFDVVEQLA
jgi:uncharacterized protein YhfF